MIVVKFGGHAMKDENGNFAQAIAAALATGEKVVVCMAEALRSMPP